MELEKIDKEVIQLQIEFDNQELSLEERAEVNLNNNAKFNFTVAVVFSYTATIRTSFSFVSDSYLRSIAVLHLLILPRQPIYFPPFLPRHRLNYSFLLKEWKSSVESIRTKLHTSFSKYMEKLQYKGEIQLRMKDTFMDWGTSQQLPPPCLCLSFCSCLYLYHFLFLCSCLRLCHCPLSRCFFYSSI